MKMDEINFKISEENGKIAIIGKPKKSMYTIKISLIEGLDKEKGRELVKYLQNNISDIDVDIF